LHNLRLQAVAVLTHVLTRVCFLAGFVEGLRRLPVGAGKGLAAGDHTVKKRLDIQGITVLYVLTERSFKFVLFDHIVA
jgi:hypothetical protein